MTRAQADLLVLLAALIWGVAFYFQKIAMLHVEAFTFVAMRAVVATAALAPFAWRERAAARASRTAGSAIPGLVPYALTGGVVFFAGSVLQQQGLITATVTNTSFLTALYVIFAPFLLWLFAGEKPGVHVWLACIICFFGIWALGGGTLSGFSTGDMFVAFSAVFWALYMVATKAGAKAQRPVGYTCLSFAVIAALSVPLAVFLERPALAQLQLAAPALLYVGILSSALTFALLSVAVRHMPGARASILLSTETLFAAAAGYLLLGERLSLIGWAGALLVLIAILIVQIRPKSIER